MITGKFLVCDDLGPLGRLVARGELMVLEPADAALLRSESGWILEKRQEADATAEKYRKWLRTAHLSNRRDVAREWFDIWAIEAAKYAVCLNFLNGVGGQLKAGKQQVMNVPRGFSYDGYGPIRALVKEVLATSDREVIDGRAFRV